MDNDNDVPFLHAGLPEARDSGDLIEGHVASTQPASLGLEAISNQAQSTVPGRVESKQPASTRAGIQWHGESGFREAGRTPNVDSVRSMRLRNRFSPLTNNEQEPGEAIAKESFALT